MSSEFRFETRRGPFSLGPGTGVAGILNVTPDSFSDGGKFQAVDDAVAAGLQMVEDGAAILDIGACSTRPGAQDVGVATELERLLPVVQALAASIRIPISIDTYHAEVFRACFDVGADILNDVSALQYDPNMAALIGETGAPCILMHMQGSPRTMQDAPQYEDVIVDIKRFFSKVMTRAERFGVSWSQTILDPGIGFGKTLEQNLSILRRIEEFFELDRPLLVGTSRKSFLGEILGESDPRRRDHGTAATTAFLHGKKVPMVRVHDVRAHVDALLVLDQLR